MSFAQSQAEIDPERLSLWGDSYTGGQVVVLSACDARPKVIVAQCPVFGAAVSPVEPSAQALEAIRQILASVDVSGTPETTTGPLPVVSPDQIGSPSLLAPMQAFRWFIEYGGRPGSGWVSRATRVIPPTPVPYSPYLCAPYVQAKTLLMVAPQDEMVNANDQVARQAIDLIPTEKQWHDIADGHFGLIYFPSPASTKPRRCRRSSCVRGGWMHERCGKGPSASAPAGRRAVRPHSMNCSAASRA